MAATSLKTDSSQKTMRNRFGARPRAGFTIVEIIVGVVVLSILAAVVIANVTPAAKQASDVERISVAAQNLDELARAIAFFEPTKPAFSFHQTVGVYPGFLSQLTVQLTTSQRNSCGTTFTNQQVTAWTGTYYGRQIPTTQFKVADGFIAQDALVRVPTTNATQERGALYIVMPAVARSDAVSLGLNVDGDASGTVGAVRYPAGDPVAVSYRIEVGGC